jgi:hypothetical protein
VAADRLRRSALWGAGGLGALVLAVGALHMPFARSLLMRAGGCPFTRPLTLAQAEAARHVAMTPNRATAVAPARPAMVFTLDQTTHDDARAWARQHRLSCDSPREGSLHCSNVPATALGLPPAPGTDAEVWLAFDAKGKLVNASTWRSHLSPDEASRTAGAITTSLTSRLGEPSWSAGALDAEHLSGASAASIGSRAYRFGDYSAEIAALNLPNSGVVVREHYISARD